MSAEFPRKKPKLNEEKIPDYEDFAEPMLEFEGDRLKLEEILDIGIIFLDFRIRKSRYFDGQYGVVQVQSGDAKGWFTTASQVVMDQLTQYKDKLPFRARITRKGRYYTLASAKEEEKT